MQKKKDVLTTGQVAQICNVAPRTVTKWFDAGQLKGYRIPGSRDRRIPTSELIRFMKAHDMPTDALETSAMRLLIIDDDWEAAENMATALQTKKNYEVNIAQNSFDAGLLAQKTVPHVILINLMASNIDATAVSKYVRTNDDLSGTKVIAMAAALKDSEAQALMKKGFDGIVTETGDIQKVIQAINNATAIIY
jgi:excisionase family DNA binding protein